MLKGKDEAVEEIGGRICSGGAGAGQAQQGGEQAEETRT